MVKHLSIITVTYNSAEQLKITIDSMVKLKKKYSEYSIKYIVVDGLSKDGTQELLDNTVIDKYIVEKDDGIYDAMNKGWNLADEGDFIIYLGAGDKILSLPQIKDNDDIVIGKTYVGTYLFNSKVSWVFKYGNTIHHQSFMISKRKENSIFDCKFKKYADFKFIQKSLLLEKRSYRIDSDFIAYADPYGVTNKLDSFEMACVVRDNFGLFSGIISYFCMVLMSVKIRMERC